MTTIEILQAVQKNVMQTLTAEDVAHMEKDDLEQEIYMYTLELLQKDHTNIPDLALLVTLHIKHLSEKEADFEETVSTFEDIISECIIAKSRTQDRLEEQVRARDTIDDLLSSCLDQDEEALLRLRFGIPTPELIEAYSTPRMTLQLRPYTLLEIIRLRDEATGRRTESVTELVQAMFNMEKHAFQKLKANSRAFLLLY